jgi:transposase
VAGESHRRWLGGATKDQLAARYGISRKSVQRLLRQYERQEHAETTSA